MTKLLSLIAAVLFLGGALAVPASAQPAARPASPPPGGTITGPTPQQYPPITYPAGEVCPFPMRLTFPVNQVVGYTYTDASGRDVATYYTGALLMKVTRTDTGRSVTKDIGGDGVSTYNTDGSTTLYGFGPFSVSLHPGDTPNGPQLDVLHGISAVRLDADGSKHILFSTRIENVCPQLQ